MSEHEKLSWDEVRERIEAAAAKGESATSDGAQALVGAWRRTVKDAHGGAALSEKGADFIARAARASRG